MATQTITIVSHAAPTQSLTQHESLGFGWHPSPHDRRDRYYKFDPRVIVSSSVDLRKNYPSAIVPPYDQEETSSCVANSTAAALWYELKKSGNDTVSRGGPSRLFIYYAARQRDVEAKIRDITAYKRDSNARRAKIAEAAVLVDRGTNNRAAMKCLDSIGVCREEIFPWTTDNVLRKPGSRCFEEARSHTIQGYYRLDPDRSGDQARKLTVAEKTRYGNFLLHSLKQCLHEDYSVVFGIRRYSSTGQWEKDTPVWTLKNIWAAGQRARHTMPAEPGFGGHSVFAIEYDDSREAVLVQNSLGVKVHDSFTSEDGLFWLPHVWVMDYVVTFDFWTLRTHRSPPTAFCRLDEILDQVEQTGMEASNT